MVPNHWNLLGKPENRRINLEKKIPNRDFALAAKGEIPFLKTCISRENIKKTTVPQLKIKVLYDILEFCRIHEPYTDFFCNRLKLKH